VTAPFAGRRVLDLSAQARQRPHALAIAMAAKLAACFGAEVLRPAADGDLIAAMPPLLPDGSSALARFLLSGRAASATGRFDVAIGDTDSLRAVDAPLVIRVSVFGVGDDPPMSELGLMALSGIIGAVQPLQPIPARLGGHQAAYAGGLAAFTAMAAGLRAGRPDTADISLFDVACWLNWKQAATVLLLGSPAEGTQRRSDWHTMKAADGHVALVYMPKDWPPLRDMIGDPRLREPRFALQRDRLVHLNELDTVMAPWFATRTRAEITREAQARRIPVGPVLTPDELLADRQHRARGFLGADGMPRLPVLWNGAAPDWEAPASRPAPSPALAGGCGTAATPQAGWGGGRGTDGAERVAAPAPLAGLRVVDLGWLTAGAASSTLLLDLGAEVIKVEGPGALDPFRDWAGAEPSSDWWNRSPFFNFTNRGKRSVCLDLKDPRGVAVLLRLLEGADILVENWRRGVLAQFGLAPAMLRERFPRLIIASISSQGEDGPERDMVSFGSTLEATGGLAALTGHTNGEPVLTGRHINYPDQVVCLFAAGAIVAAVMQRDATGQGTHIDLSQRELTSFLLGEELLAAAAGVPSARLGNADVSDAAEDVVAGPDGFRARWAGGEAPVRDGPTLAAAPEFKAGSAILTDPEGRPAKGTPWRFASRPPALERGCTPLGADNRAVLEAAGLAAEEIAALERAGVLATAPRRGPLG
jgi:crotonobetainyl-CoA:carnitine CoA-transferase CaiB-like acyl-CoA transferase